MNKIKIIKTYIKQIDNCIKNGNRDEKYNLQKLIIGIYAGEINKFTNNLNTYIRIYSNCSTEELNQDLLSLKGKLENYIGTLKYNHQAGGLSEKMANHPVIVLGTTIITAFGIFYGALMGIMNISNTEFIAKDSYIKKDVIKNQYILKEDVKNNYVEIEKYNNLMQNSINLRELTDNYISLEKHNEIIIELSRNKSKEFSTKN